jgi:hypothetical protein
MSNRHRFVVMSTMAFIHHEKIDHLVEFALHYFAISCCMQNHLNKPLDKPLARTPSFKPVDKLGITCG